VVKFDASETLKVPGVKAVKESRPEWL